MNQRDKFLKQEISNLNNFFKNTSFGESLVVAANEIASVQKIAAAAEVPISDEILRTIISKVTIIQCSLSQPQLYLLNAVQMVDNFKSHIMALTDINCVFEMVEEEPTIQKATKILPEKNESLALLLKRMLEEGTTSSSSNN